MQSHDEIAVPACLEEVTLCVAIELDGRSRVVGINPPGPGKFGLKALKASDARGLIALIERHREDALKKN